MLHVQRREDINTGGEQFPDILPTLGMAAARGVGVRKLVDQRERRPARENGVDVHLRQGSALIFDLLLGNDLKVLDQCLRLGAAVGLYDANQDIDPSGFSSATLGQHLEGLADTGRGAEENLETATALLRGFAQKGLRGRSVAIGPSVHLADLRSRRSSCRLSSSTLTCASPKMPSVASYDRPRDEIIAPSAAECPRGRDAPRLVQRICWRDVRVEAGTRRSHHVGRNGSGHAVGACLTDALADVVGECFRGRAKI